MRELIRRDSRSGNLWWVSEGDPKLGLSPFLRVASPDGKFVEALPTPEMFRMDQGSEMGPRRNFAFEALSFAPDGNSVSIAADPRCSRMGRSRRCQVPARSRHSPSSATARCSGSSPYPLDSIPGSAGRQGRRRQWRRRVPGAGRPSGPGARTVRRRRRGRHLEALHPDLRDRYRRRHRHRRRAIARQRRLYSGLESLIIDLAKTPDVGVVDNIEAMSWGPPLSNGKRSLILVSDNNFDPAQITQFLAFEVAP